MSVHNTLQPNQNLHKAFITKWVLHMEALGLTVVQTKSDRFEWRLTV